MILSNNNTATYQLEYVGDEMVNAWKGVKKDKQEKGKRTRGRDVGQVEEGVVTSSQVEHG